MQSGKAFSLFLSWYELKRVIYLVLDSTRMVCLRVAMHYLQQYNKLIGEEVFMYNLCCSCKTNYHNQSLLEYYTLRPHNDSNHGYQDQIIFRSVRHVLDEHPMSPDSVKITGATLHTIKSMQHWCLLARLGLVCVYSSGSGRTKLER